MAKMDKGAKYDMTNKKRKRAGHKKGSVSHENRHIRRQITPKKTPENRLKQIVPTDK